MISLNMAATTTCTCTLTFVRPSGGKCQSCHVDVCSVHAFWPKLRLPHILNLTRGSLMTSMPKQHFMT
jgi:hypothetical protein